MICFHSNCYTNVSVGLRWWWVDWPPWEWGAGMAWSRGDCYDILVTCLCSEMTLWGYFRILDGLHLRCYDHIVVQLIRSVTLCRKKTKTPILKSPFPKQHCQFFIGDVCSWWNKIVCVLHIHMSTEIGMSGSTKQHSVVRCRMELIISEKNLPLPS